MFPIKFFVGMAMGIPPWGLLGLPGLIIQLIGLGLIIWTVVDLKVRRGSW